MSDEWTDDDSQRAQEEEEAYWEDKFINEWEFFDDALESWNSLGESVAMGEDEE